MEHHESARLAALRHQGILDTPQDPDFDDFTWLLSRLCQVPISTITLVDVERQWFKSRIGLDVAETDRSVAFCAHTIRADDVMEVRDALEDPRFRDNPLVTGPPRLRFYAGAPIRTSTGYRIGTVTVMDRVPRRLDPEQEDALVRVAGQVGRLIELRAADQANSRLVLLLGHALDVATMAPWEYDVETRLFTLNDRFYALYGTSVEAEGGYVISDETYALEFCHPEDREGLHGGLRKAVEASGPGFVATHEHRVVGRDGKLRHVEVKFGVTKDSMGRTSSVYGAVQDVTARRLEEAWLEDQNAQLAARVQQSRKDLGEQQEFNLRLLENLAEGVVACDAEGRLVLFNRVAREWHGTDPLRIPQDQWSQYYDLFEGDGTTPMVLERIPLVRAFGGAEVRNQEMSIVAKGRPPRLIVASGSPVFDGEGRKLGAVVVMRDVTESRRHARRFTDLFEFAPDALLIIDEEGAVSEANRQASAVFGRSREGMRGSTVSDFFRTTVGGDLGSLFAGTTKDVGEPQAMAHGELVGIRNDQTEFPVEVTTSPIEADNGLVTLVAVRDVTERVKAESRARMALATLDATTDAAFTFAADTLRFEYVSEGAVRQLGYSRDELLSMTPLDVQPEFDDETFRELLRPLFTREMSEQRVTTVHRRKLGDDLPVEINLQLVHPDGETPRFIAIVRDITERVKLERQANRSQRLEAIGTLAGGVAHDLNNTLAPILMAVELLRAENPGESELLDLCHASAKRGAAMVRQLLTFAKGADGDRVSIQVREIVEEMETIIRGTFPKNVSLSTSIAGELPSIVGDPTQVHQVLLNLCVNARDAMPDGGQITLGAAHVDVDDTFASTVPDAKPGQYVCLSVQDTGSGIPASQLDRIFEPFFTTKPVDRGTGLGLSTAMGIVRGHGGFVHVYSSPDEGSLFKVYIPVESGSESVGDGARPAPDFRGDGQTVLVVDDERPVRAVARRVLRNLGFQVVTASDGAEALIEVAQAQESLDVVITDFHMPHMDGLAFVRMLRRMMPDVPVLVTSGRLDAGARGEFHEIGVRHFLEKPFTQDDLARALQTVLPNPPATS